jgi:hypothetical protein
LLRSGGHKENKPAGAGALCRAKRSKIMWLTEFLAETLAYLLLTSTNVCALPRVLKLYFSMPIYNSQLTMKIKANQRYP